ncbi:MAG: Mannosylglycerate hydrolase [Candidatus Latescibacteria bacterium ADurb.Bin168]|nr:MAG: Mannosylglycerate hydrolase [Candidatus Latescibacteria bacterium ADurb.Bin168]
MEFVHHPGPYHVYLVPHSHIDVEWYWTYDKTRVWSRDILESAIELLERKPEETFSQDQTPVLELLAEQRQHLSGTPISQWLTSGRLEILGGFVQPEVAEPDGECLIRQFVLGRKRAKEMFGVAQTVGWLIDTFGQVPQIPQILVGCGMDSYVFMRGVPRRLGEVPTAFWCESPDGTRVLTYWMASGYTTSAGTLLDSLKEEIAHSSSQMIMIGWGADVTNPAEAPAEKAREALLNAATADGLPLASVTIATPGAFFRALREQAGNLPTVCEDFAPVDDRFADLRGTYSNRARHKIANRKAEAALLAAEAWNALAVESGSHDFTSELETLWRRLLFSQFHDTIGGSCTDQVYEKALKRCNTVVDFAEDITDKSLEVLAATADTGAFRYPVLVFNPSSFPRTDVAEYEMVFREEPTNFRVVQADGKEVLHVIGNPRGSRFATSGAIATAHVTWLASDVPPMGFKVFAIEPIPGRAASARATAGTGSVENEWYRVQIDPTTGDVAQITDLSTGYRCLDGAGNEIVAREEKNPNLEGWVGLTGKEERTSHTPAEVRVEVEKNNLFQRVVTRRAFLGCQLVREVSLFRGVRRIHCRTRFLGFAGGDVLVSVRFPAALSCEGEIVYETPFAMTPRDRSYHCAQKVVDIHDGVRGLAIINVGTAGHFPVGNALDMILFRSLRDFPDYYAPLAAEHGDHSFEYAVIPHAGEWRDGNVVAEGHAVNAPFLVHFAGMRRGAHAESHSLLSVSPRSVRVSAVKRAESGTGLVVRMWETHGKPTEAKLVLDMPFSAAWSATMEEQPIAPLQHARHEIRVPLRGWQISTILIHTQPHSD